MEKLPISIGILAWKSGQTLVNTLQTYFNQEFLHQINDVCILFQEFSEQDKDIANHFGIPYIAKKENIGIGSAFIELTEQAKTENVLVLEHDWKLIEDKELARTRLLSGVKLLDNGFITDAYYADELIVYTDLNINRGGLISLSTEANVGSINSKIECTGGVAGSYDCNEIDLIC